MLRRLELRDVGPAREMAIDLGERLNVFAGDNGLGKSFVLEVLWWALTGTWAELPAWPRPDAASAPEIALTIENGPGAPLLEGWETNEDVQFSDGSARARRTFNLSRQEWLTFPLALSTRPVPALVLFARSDGTFALWDPARNHHTKRPKNRWGTSAIEADADPATLRLPPAYVFDTKQLWDGLESHGKTLCNGLVRDWVSWQQQTNGSGERPFDLLSRILHDLSPHPDTAEEIIRPGPPTRVFVDDARDFPTIDFGYGPVPVIHASAGMRRILSLAYLVVWAWHEHLAASKLQQQAPVQRIVFLMDEVENHLHPAWQRRIVRAILDVLQGLAPGMEVQAFLTTHAPLVLASLEPLFAPERDRFFVFDLDATSHTVTLDEVPWVKTGDATDWLVSPAFNLDQARSVEAETAIEDAEAR